jgi:bifunctional ADP-heptose synthase (sugar kinase/adenylyltransferase)
MSLDTALALIDFAADKDVLFIGDAIVDEYHYVKPLGKSPKEYIIPLKWQSQETFVGGTHAAANHAKSFCKSVNVCTPGPITTKVRFVDAVYNRKLSEVHYEKQGWSDSYSMSHDCIVVTDFGHGALTEEDIGDLCARAPYLAVNAQTNSANAGFNLVTKYRRADYVVVDEPEARLAAQDRDSSIETVMVKLSQGRFKKIIVTLGVNGAIGYDPRVGYRHCKAFTDRAIDTMGAGDAFFAVTAPMADEGTLEDLLLIGNAAGALKTQIVGHRKSVTKDALIGYLREAAY